MGAFLLSKKRSGIGIQNKVKNDEEKEWDSIIYIIYMDEQKSK